MDSPVRFTTMAPVVMRSQIVSAVVGTSIRRGKLSGGNWEVTPFLTGSGKAASRLPWWRISLIDPGGFL